MCGYEDDGFVAHGAWIACGRQPTRPVPATTASAQIVRGCQAARDWDAWHPKTHKKVKDISRMEAGAGTATTSCASPKADRTIGRPPPRRRG